MRKYKKTKNARGESVFTTTLENGTMHEITEIPYSNKHERSYTAFCIDYWRDDDATPYRYASGLRSLQMAEAVVELQIARLDKIGNVYEQIESAFASRGKSFAERGDLEDILNRDYTTDEYLELVFGDLFKNYIPITDGWALLKHREPNLFDGRRCPWQVACAVALLADKHFIE